MWQPPPLGALAARLVAEPAALAQDARRAAVAAVLREASGDLEVLLIRRAERPGDPWSGHIALPGGHAHRDDKDLEATAARETLEEVGIDLTRSGTLLGSLSDVTPMTGLTLNVRPFCYALREPAELRLSDEVERAFWVPLGPLALGRHDSYYEFQRGNTALSFPAWRIEQHVVWGMTYRLLSELLQRIVGP